MTPEQRIEIIDYRAKGAKRTDCARMAGVPVRDFVGEYKLGAREHEQGEATEAAEFYREFERAGAVYVSTLRAQAEVTAGSRESEDLRRLANDFEAAEDAFTGDPLDGRSQGVDLPINDLLAHGDLTDTERAELKATHEAWSKAGLEAFDAMLRVQSRMKADREA